MKSAPGWLWDSPTDIDERLRKPLAVFRRADNGARPLAADTDREGPYRTLLSACRARAEG